MSFGREYVEIGPTPVNESCQGVGMPDYDEKLARLECQTYLEQIRRQKGEEPEGAELRVKRNSHEFGTYMEVVCYYEDPYVEDEATGTMNTTAIDYAYDLEAHAPLHWDQESKSKLWDAGHPLGVR